MKKKTLAITIGDPAGIGCEIVLKSLSQLLPSEVFDAFLVGDSPVIESASKLTGLNLSKGVRLIETGVIKDHNFKKAEASATGGEASASYIKKAVEMALSGDIDAIVTAPISKESLKMAGLKWPGHTEMLAELTDTKEYAMMLCGDKLRVMLVTIHEPLRKVPELLTVDKVLTTIGLAQRACRMFDIADPKIAVAGLNPHAGEAGLFGKEEIDFIIPAIKQAKKSGLNVTGPYPADTLFYKAYRGDFDIVICMYHDQCLIPLKMVAFERGVNVTVGLPFVRTSPDHGTAYDIAWKGVADPSSMIEAIKLALRLRS